MKPTTQIKREGNRRFKTFSYVVTLCQIGGDDVKAVRLDGHTSKFDLDDEVAKNYPGWKIKSILKLYKSDFEED